MHRENLKYKAEDTVMDGFLVYDPSNSKRRPAVIVAHAWYGQDDFAREKARELAQLGYVAFAADLYGNRREAKSDEEAVSLMGPLFLDRKLLRQRIVAAYDTVKKCPLVDPRRIGAIGFCFGGLTVIELLRSGVDIRGVVSFHGVLGDTLGEFKAQLEPPAKHIPGALLILHGHDDPLVSAQDIAEIQTEFTQAQVDWQMNIYGHTSHAFTNPLMNDANRGLVYNSKISQRAWWSMRHFFEEFFK